MSAPEYDTAQLRAIIEEQAAKNKPDGRGWIWVDLPLCSFHLGTALIDELNARGIGLRRPSLKEGDQEVIFAGGGKPFSRK